MGGAIMKNVALHTELSELLDSFIKLIAGAVDAKSPYTGGHCRRVPDLVMDFANAIHDAEDGPFGTVRFSDADMYELHVAGWLHDIGKICIPEYVMDKATKLETIYDRIHEVEARIEILKRDAEISMLKNIMNGGERLEAEATFRRVLEELDDDMLFLRRVNIGGEFMHDEDIARVHQIASRELNINGVTQPLLSSEYVENLCIRRGTLTEVERDKIRDHMRITIDMLEQLPFPKNLQRVPEFAGGHHETMIGTGYPKGLTREQMSIQARMMAIVDVFEALTAADRPYKPAKKLSEAMRIMGFMKKDHHLDPELFNEFVRLEVYMTFANKHMSPEHIDEINKEALMGITPKPL
jgi:response regulator RpfG family c-di-GMP phosphodiesterase